MLTIKECNDFMSYARLAASQSLCIKKKVGAVLTVHSPVSGKYQYLNSSYGGWISACNVNAEGLCPRKYISDWQQDGCHSIHAEQRLIMNTLFRYHNFFDVDSKLKNKSTLFVTHGPCDQCIKFCVFVGVNRIIYEIDYKTNYAKWNKHIEIIKLSDIKDELS